MTKARARILATGSLLAACSLFVGLAVVALAVVRDYPLERLSVTESASLVVSDRSGRPLWQAASESGEKRDWTPLADMAPLAVQATLAAEDHRFYQHRGVDPFAVLRALWLDVRALAPRFGASTLSMQLVRLADPELDTRSVAGKLEQALLALRLERALGKRAIVEQYLNRAYYGNGAFGLSAAARQYFGLSAAGLSPAQAAFLAALPRAPSGYDPYRHRARAERRMRHVLDRMHELGWLDDAAHRLACDVPLALRREPRSLHARHFLDYLLVSLPSELRRGARLRSTLDLDLQERLEVATRRHLDRVGSRSISQAGLVVLDNETGDVLAMVGSRDYADRERAGAVNVTVLPRRAGSTLKPFAYALALEQGDSPATLVYDVVLPGESNETYAADVRQHGFARYREALASSYNLAAVHVLQKVGVRNLARRLELAGVTTLGPDPAAHGLDLAIGNAEISLLEYTGAFAAFGNAGKAVRARAVLGLEWPRAAEPRDASRDVSRHAVPPPALTQVFSPAVAYQIFDVLSDPDARRPMFGSTAPFEVGFPVAVKTGTTRGYTDNLAFGTTREFSVGAWAGNFDGTPTEGVMAMRGAAPLVRAAFVALAALYGLPSAPDRPRELTLREVCPLSGARPGPHCPGRKHELFSPASARAFDEGPPCAFHAAPNRAGTPHALAGLAFPPELGPWARAHELPDRSRREPAPGASLSFAYPRPGSRFQLDPHRAARFQAPPLVALPGADVTYRVDGRPSAEFVPSPGRHVVSAQRGRERAELAIVYE